MATERYRRRSRSAEEFDPSLMYDDIEKMREREEEEEKDENVKLGSAGMMALLAGAGLLTLGLVGSPFGSGDLIEFLNVTLNVIGFGALGYGFFKTLKLAFRQKELNFPALNVYRKSKPASRQSESRQKTAAAGTKTKNPESRREKSQNQQRRRYQETSRSSYRRPAATTRRNSLRRSRTNRVFSGVAGGIAEYFGVSASLIRFALISACFIPPLFLMMPTFLYLFLSIAIPNNYDQFHPNANPNASDDSRFRNI